MPYQKEATFLQFLGDVALQTYFRFITIILWFVNLFIPKKAVAPPRNRLLFKSIHELISLITTRKIKISAIVEAYIQRIEEVNPIINAVAYKNFEEARFQAETADAKIKSLSDAELIELYKKQRLFGLPFTVKDSFQIKGKPCTVGVLDRKRRQTLSEITATAPQKFFNEGAIFLAVTTIPETCLWVETNTVAYGKTSNPYDIRRIVGGSSGGEGALHGAGASLFGIGSDLGGSIRIPAYHNGIFGFLPTPHKVNGEGHIPGLAPGTYNMEMGRIGPITRFAKDLPLLLDILSGKEIDQTTRIPLKKVKIFYAEGCMNNRQEPQQQIVVDCMHKAVAHFEEKYDITAQCIALPETADLLNMYGVSIFEEGHLNIACIMKDITKVSEPVNCYLELIKYIFGKREYSLPTILFPIAPWCNYFTSEQHKILREKRDRFRNRIVELLSDNGVLFFPSWKTLPQYHWETVLKHTTFPFTGLFNMLQLPAVQCPMGLINGLPIGVQIATNKENDQILIEIAQEISNTFGGWVPPGQNKDE